MSGLTRPQQDLLDFLRTRIIDGQVTPSFDEMATHLGLRSKSGAHRLLAALEERGFVRRLPNRARSIELVDKTGDGFLGELPIELRNELRRYCAQRQIQPRVAIIRGLNLLIHGSG